MFPNKSFLGKFSKLSKYKPENRSDPLLCFLGGNAVSRVNSPKMSFFTPAESNGFWGRISSAKKLPEMLGNWRGFSQASDGKCWKCNKVLDLKGFSCASCGVLQRPKPSVNYFQLLGVSQMYEVDLDELTQKFRNMQMLFHPDKFANKSMEELEISESYSSLLNKAYTTLKDPRSRGFYLLELQNMNSSTTNPLQQDFLMQVMEKNEELDSIDKQSTLEQFMQTNNEAIANQIKLINEAFRSNQIDSAKINLLKLNYYMNLDNKIKEKQDSFNSPDL